MPRFDLPERRDHVGETEDQLRDQRVGKATYAKSMEYAARQDARDEIQERRRAELPPRMFESRCSICNHPYRNFIEAMLLRGHTYKGLQERINPRVSRQAISNHHKKHMDLQDAALRDIIEHEARIMGVDYEEGKRDAITKRSVLEIALRKGYEDLLEGVTTVEPRDLIQIAKLLADMDSQAYQTGLDEMRVQMQIFLQAIRDACKMVSNGDEVQQLIVARVQELREQDGVGIAMERMVAQPQIAEATVVEE